MSGRMTAGEFVEAFRAGRTQEIEGREVVGNVSLHGETIARAVRALDMTFWGEVDLSECRFDRSVDLAGCRFAKTLTLRNTEIGGSLDLSNAVVRTEGSASGQHAPDAVSVDLRGLRVAKDLVLDGLEVAIGSLSEEYTERGCVVATGMRIGGDANFDAMRLDVQLDVSSSNFDGNVSLQAARESLFGRDRCFMKALEATGCVIAGNLVMTGLEIVYDATMWNTQIGGVFFARATFPGLSAATRWRPTKIGGDLHLASSNIAYADWESLEVGGALRLFAAKVGRLRCRFTESDEPCAFGQVDILGTNFATDLDLSGVVVTGRSKYARRRGIHIEGATIDGDLKLWSPMALLGSDGYTPIPGTGPPSSLAAVVSGDVSIVGCNVGGEVNLTNLQTTGRIVLDDCRVTRDVALCSAATARHDLLRCGEPEEAIRAGLLATRAQALSMVNLRCENDVDLTGLHLADEVRKPADPLLLDQPSTGHVMADGVEVSGRFQLFEEGAEADCGARIPGALDLSGARLGELMLSFHSFETEARDAKVGEVGLILATAQIDRFTLTGRECDDTDGGPHLKIPRPLDLRDAKVGQWNVYDPADEQTHGLSRFQAYDSVLAAEEKFRRSTHLMIEASLRDRGHDEEADLVYRAMAKRAAQQRRRDRRNADGRRAKMALGDRHPEIAWLTGSGSFVDRIRTGVRRPVVQRSEPDDGFVERLWTGVVPPKEPHPIDVRARRSVREAIVGVGQAAYGGLLGYGTAPGRLIWLIAIGWLVMLPFYADPANYEPSLSRLAVLPEYVHGTGEPQVDKDDMPGEWSFGSGVAISASYHVPMIAAVVRDEWALKDQPGAYYLGRRLDSVVPEDVGLIALTLNWILWPIVITFFVTRFLRIDRSRK